ADPALIADLAFAGVLATVAGIDDLVTEVLIVLVPAVEHDGFGPFARIASHAGHRPAMNAGGEQRLIVLIQRASRVAWDLTKSHCREGTACARLGTRPCLRAALDPGTARCRRNAA